MIQWKKPIRNDGGFTLVEVLIALSCIVISRVLLMLVVFVLQRLQEPVYYSEDRIAMYQLRFLFTQSSRLSLQGNILSFIYQKKKQTPEYSRRRLVRGSGHKIFLQDVDTLQLQKRKECYYVIWIRKEKREEVLFTCE